MGALSGQVCRKPPSLSLMGPQSGRKVIIGGRTQEVLAGASRERRYVPPGAMLRLFVRDMIARSLALCAQRPFKWH